MEDLKRIGRREFLLHTHKYLKESQFILTNHGNDELYIKIEPTVIKDKTQETPKPIKLSIVMQGQYSCGCQREDNLVLCSKHSRY